MGTRIFVFFPLCFVVVAVWTQVYNSSMEKLVKSMRCILVERKSNIVGREPWKLKTVKNPPAMWETWAQSLGWEDLPGGRHGNPLKYSCLENPHGQRSLAGHSPQGC